MIHLLVAKVGYDGRIAKSRSISEDGPLRVEHCPKPIPYR
jgi:hypothetical protein